MLLRIAERIIDLCFARIPCKVPSLQNLSKVCLIAHRGAHNIQQQIIENTDAAFAHALALGCWGIEFDVHATADNVLVVNHDPTLDRLWGKNAAIRDLNFKNLRQLAPQIPKLSEVVERYGKKMHLFIELKAPLHAETVLSEDLQSLEPGKDYHLITLNEVLFTALTTFPREIMLLVPLHNNVSYFCKQVIQKNYGGILGHYLLLTPKKIKALRLADKIVGVGLVDSQAGLYRELNRDIFWVFSNNVSFLKECIQKSLRSERAHSS